MKTEHLKCIKCGKFVKYETMDSGTPYGCSDPENPEPLPMEYWCESCAKEEYIECIKLGTKMYNYWQKPTFQYKAMEKLGIIEKDFNLIYETKT